MTEVSEPAPRLATSVTPAPADSPEPPAKAPSPIDGIRRISALQLELTRFAADRARKNASSLAAFAICRSPQSVLETWRLSALEAITDYADEAAKLLDRAHA